MKLGPFIASDLPLMALISLKSNPIPVKAALALMDSRNRLALADGGGQRRNLMRSPVASGSLLSSRGVLCRRYHRSLTVI